MARVTVEDCIDKVKSPYELVLVAKERATQLNSGIEPTVDRDNDKNTVIALREIADSTLIYSVKNPSEEDALAINISPGVNPSALTTLIVVALCAALAVIVVELATIN